MIYIQMNTIISKTIVFSYILWGGKRARSREVGDMWKRLKKGGEKQARSREEGERQVRSREGGERMSTFCICCITNTIDTKYNYNW